ncbi:MAG: CoA transferase [Novosphingobium sp.]|nr:CoA transferase [Novosphingobium sp.]
MPDRDAAALDGLKIVDFSRFLPGAYPSWIAADMGAEVVRIEHPREIAKHAAMFGRDDDPAQAARAPRPAKLSPQQAQPDDQSGPRRRAARAGKADRRRGRADRGLPSRGDGGDGLWL